MTREQYVQLCRDIWDKTKYDPEYERKVLIDFSQPVTLGQLVGADQLTPDFADSALLAAPVAGGFDGKHDIECLVLLTARVPAADSANILQSRVAETFAPAQIPSEPSEALPDFYILALFDVLGFSALVQRIGAEAILSLYKDLIARTVVHAKYTSLARLELSPGNYTIGGSYAPIGHAYFSDTILLWTPARLTHLAPFLARCSDLICEALKLGLPLRGSISAGEAVMHKASQTFLGSALVEASDIEKNQMWIGATLGEGFVVRDLKDALSETQVVPLYCDHFKPTMPISFPYLTLDWPERWGPNKEGLVRMLEGMRQGAPPKNLPYYDNTLEFLRYRELDSPQARALYLRAPVFRVVNLRKVNLDGLRNRPIILKVRGEIPRSGYLVRLPTRVLKTNRKLRRFCANHLLFVRRLDWAAFLHHIGSAVNVHNLLESAFVSCSDVSAVEYIDAFNLDPDASQFGEPGEVYVVE